MRQTWRLNVRVWRWYKPGGCNRSTRLICFACFYLSVTCVLVTQLTWKFLNMNRYLYDILTNKEVVRRKIPLLLTCNKMDKVTAHSSNFIRGQLEKEL